MVIIETSVLTRRVRDLLTDEEYRELQVHLADYPTLGRIITVSDGLRKVRWGSKGRGKRGGVRVIYYCAARHERLLMLLIYGKNERDDLSQDQLKVLRELVEEEYP